MFEDSLIESGRRLKTGRGRTTTFSVVLQAIIVGIMVLLPLLFTEALPKTQLMMALVAPAPPPPLPPAVVRIVKQAQTDVVNRQLRTPTRIPREVKIITEDPPPPVPGVVGSVPGDAPSGHIVGVISGIIGSNTPVAVPKVTVKRLRVSQGVTQGMVVHKVEPVYPPLARTAGVQGSVVLAAIIGKDGTIQNLHVVSGHPLLTKAALEAVKQWRYRPYILNSEPVEVDTEVTVNFTLSGG
jgi:protein TonB